MTLEEGRVPVSESTKELGGSLDVGEDERDDPARKLRASTAHRRILAHERAAPPGRSAGCREPAGEGRLLPSPVHLAPLAQRQSNGLLIRRFWVRIPGGALFRCVLSADGVVVSSVDGLRGVG